MATRTSNGKKLGKVNGWGIAEAQRDGTYALVYIGNGRLETRAVKRETYPGNAYKTVRINAVLTQYNK